MKNAGNAAPGAGHVQIDDALPKLMVNAMDLEIRLSGRRHRIHCELHDEMEVGVDYYTYVPESLLRAERAKVWEEAEELARTYWDNAPNDFAGLNAALRSICTAFIVNERKSRSEQRGKEGE